jgi:hypothetical protein
MWQASIVAAATAALGALIAWRFLPARERSSTKRSSENFRRRSENW